MSNEVQLKTVSPHLTYIPTEVTGYGEMANGHPVSTIGYQGFIEPNFHSTFGDDVPIVLIWTPRTIIIKGEVRCFNGIQEDGRYIGKQTTQTNILINITLERGWNVVNRTTMKHSYTAKGIETFDKVWGVLPARELEKWKSFVRGITHF